ncbi:MAG: Uma2 family endonuclease [Terriglobia bacterium]
MPSVASPPEQRVVLGNVAWETYERLLDEHSERSSPRFTYDRGALEIISPSAEHEWYSRLICDLVKLLTRELRIDVLDLGSTTFRRAAAKRGFEPDSAFYVTHARQVRGKERIDLAVNPPPDIVVEVAVTHPSISEFPICAELGVPEVWSYDGSFLHICGLSGSEYMEMPSSRVLPRLHAKELSEFLEMGRAMDSVTWPNEVLERFRRPA